VKRVVTLAAVLILPMLLFPPWEVVYQNYRATLVEYAGYHPLWSPPRGEERYGLIAHPRIPLVQLMVQAAGALLFSIVLIQIPWTNRITIGSGASRNLGPPGQPGGVTMKIDEKVWTVSRQIGVTTGARAAGDSDVKSQPSGLWFHSDKGDHRFLVMDLSELPTDAQVREITVLRFDELLKRAKP
jgi:hypothetical protein